MYRIALLFVFIEVLLCQNHYPSTPVEFRGLWCISTGNQNSYRQIGQAFFYNNETFTLNWLNNIQDTWINNFIQINNTDNQGTYQILTDTSKGLLIYVNKTSCFWRRQISNGDILWSRLSNGTCTPSFELDDSDTSTRYTRNAMNCTYVNDENPNEILSNSSFENALLRFDRSLKDMKQQSIVFYGSSSIRYWSSLNNDFSHTRMNLINRGFGGSTLKQCYQQFKRIILPLEPRILFIYAGENDISSGETSANIHLIFRQLISMIRRFFPSLPIAYISIKPSPSRFDKIQQVNQTNYLIQNDIQTMHHVSYIDIFNEMLTADGKPRKELFIEDNLHMNEQGYAIWTRAVNNYLQTNDFISKGVIHNEMSMLLIILNLFVFYIFS
ncbi:hypothetical protein I4U23_024499 [Adineta vaga]|nr:hypothetical protein I4U23_024499 [Adineta vaga]